MKWRSRSDHGQKHETGDWMHSEVAEPKLHFSQPMTRARFQTQSRCRKSMFKYLREKRINGGVRSIRGGLVVLKVVPEYVARVIPNTHAVESMVGIR